MVHDKSLDPYRQIIAALLCDVQNSHSEVFPMRALRLTTEKVEKRMRLEGIAFLTKTLPRLGRALDRALSGEVPLDAAKLAFKSLPNSKLPMFMGELFKCIFSHDGFVLQTPCVKSIIALKQLLSFFGKLELPYAESLEQAVLQKFEKTDDDLRPWNQRFTLIGELLDAGAAIPSEYSEICNTVRLARDLLKEVFREFDPYDIHPRHGPGVVSTKETMSDKYTFRRISPRLLAHYPFDAYFCASQGHVCDTYEYWSRPFRLKAVAGNSYQVCESSARVILVPKDSRGPRLISCEPLDFQWIQQGLGRAIVQHVESHPLTRYGLHYSDQVHNQLGALLGSSNGEYATLDLNEASDRISTELVRLLFPSPLKECLLAARSESTTLPDGRIKQLEKYAPMGSALCFPVMSITCWAVLQAGLSDAHTKPSVRNEQTFLRSVRNEQNGGMLVYGDDIIVPTAQAENSIKILESFGLKVNRDKSFYSGFFRESCGVDAYRGVKVTPVRIRTVWCSSPSPDAYVSYIAYANALHAQCYYTCYDVIVKELFRIYGEIPEASLNVTAPSLVVVPEAYRPKRRRVNKSLQKLEWHVRDIRTPLVTQTTSGWNMLLRFFAEATSDSPFEQRNSTNSRTSQMQCSEDLHYVNVRTPFSVSQYTKRSTSYLVKRWR